MFEGKVTVELIMIIAFIIIGIQLFRGKWLMLMAGYNTSSKEKREQMNGKALGRLLACLLWITSACMIFLQFFPQFEIETLIVVTATILFVLIYANTSKRYKK